MGKLKIVISIILCATVFASCGSNGQPHLIESVGEEINSMQSLESYDLEETAFTSDEELEEISENILAEEENVLPKEENQNNPEIREGVSVNIAPEYKGIVRNFLDKYINGDEFIPETFNSAWSYDEKDPGVFLCLDADGDGYDEVFVTAIPETKCWDLIGQRVDGRRERLGGNYRFYGLMPDLYLLPVEYDFFTEDDESNRVYFHDIDFFVAGWQKVQFTEGYTMEELLVDKDNNLYEEKYKCYKDGQETIISKEEYERATNIELKGFEEYKDRIFKITPANVQYYFGNE